MPFAPSICFELVSYILVSTEYLSNVAFNGQIGQVRCGFPRCLLLYNLTSFRPFLPAIVCCFLYYWHAAWVLMQERFKLAFRSEMTGFEMIPDMLVINVFPAVFVTLGPANFSYSFRRCRISIVYFFPA